ncbi:MAG TPA: hypothetical protein VMU04_00905 [Candidatus Acidoferrum sp.]|nr:hypothetical protein [Candidatus Acidoferrum sp.]
MLGIVCLCCLLLAGATAAHAQQFTDLEPRWLRLDIPQASVGMDVEGLREDVTSQGVTSVHDNLLLVPVVGLHLAGSVYHPNFMTFDLTGSGGIGYAYDSVTSPGYSMVRNESQNLFTYLATVNFLSSKPYNASFFASQDHTYNNYDFFNTVTADSTRYGGRIGWSEKSFNLNADMGYRDLTTSGITGTTEISETYLNFNGLDQRDHGSSTLTYSYDNFDNQLNGGPVQNSMSQSVGASDTETFGSHDQITQTAGASYGWADYANESAQTFNATENLIARHTPNLESFLALNYQDSHLDGASASQFQGDAGLRHQLYESLVSTLDFHGNYGTASGPNTSANDDRYGVGLNEGYSKRLGSWGHLSLGGGAIVDHQDFNNSGGGALTTINESHVLKDTAATFLNNPRVIATSVLVTGPGGVPTYVNGVDYRLIPAGELTQIQRIPTSINLPDGSTVLVSYQSDSLYTSSYETLNTTAEIRLDIYNTVGVYGRLNYIDNNAPPQALAETLTDLVGGADVTWRWLRAGAEYESFDSNFTEYRATRFFETFSFQLGESSRLGLNFNQVFYKYPGGQDQTQYQCIALFNTQLSYWLSWNVEGGYYRQDALGVSQDLAAARTGLILTYGKLTLKAGYQYNYQKIDQAEERDRNFFYVQFRRDF